MAARRSSSGGASLAVWLGLALIVIVLDQFSKTLILGHFQLHESRHVTDFFNVVRAHNSGAAFSFLAGAGGWQRWFFIGLGVVASGLMLWMLKKHPAQTLFCFAISMILGGAVGNVIDRALHGYVVDMLDFHWAGRHFATFNLADSAITLGAICLIVDELMRVRRGR